MKPNVIIINADDLGYGDLKCYGNSVNKTPYLDHMAQKGTVFTSCYSASSLCTPSRAGLMTGCYPPRVSMNRVLFPGEAYGLNDNEYTMSKMFKQNGYKTMIIGKWHLGDQVEFLPDRYGFDDYYGIPYSNDMGRQLKKDSSITEFPPLPLISGSEVVQQQPDQCSITERYTEKAVEFIRENKSKNFFLYLAHMHVHLPLYSGKRFVDESENGDFGACVAELDWSCGVIMQELKQLGLEENTLVIFTSDNGSKANFGASNYPLKGAKGSSYEGGFRVPMIAVWKDKIKENVRCNSIISQIDFLPTLQTMMGTNLNSDVIDGCDMTNTLFNGQNVRDTFVYFAGRHREEKLGLATIEAIRHGDYKLFFYRRNAQSGLDEQVYELYNLVEDISESKNLYSETPEIVSQITKLYNDYQSRLGNHSTGIEGEEVRAVGSVENPVALTCYDPNHPYIVSYYDKLERG